MKYAIQEHKGDFLVKRAWNDEDRWITLKKASNPEEAVKYLQDILDDILKRGGVVRVIEDHIITKKGESN